MTELAEIKCTCGAIIDVADLRQRLAAAEDMVRHLSAALDESIKDREGDNNGLD